ncbi:hypothetical protein NG800_007580 [Epilithonimonas ginsengisoli]|uniref:Lipoprotein n=1 Tax=Epilithonimonas ginsengisoli TaxID=1245592 RepID=A0ABU4JGG9_9FLAO|nr:MULTISPECIES: hypothetical protein [Chryseobacterium group]MBV6880205.1 hypothetical protein [Epilithonimonas sp. FP105]MDW8548767.1 hypothetical protein [Epilithonimonas ginsengisoli]OAH76150.1 hypothetical protein AXA65_01280 [Chryseobacterium sp. FP211-J200]
MMKIIKIGFVLSALTFFLLSCKTTAQTTSAIKSVSYRHTMGRGGATSINATKDSLESSARGGRTAEFPSFKKKINPKDWTKLVAGLDISLLEKTQSGEIRGHYDGPDQIFTIVTDSKEYEFYNVPAESPGYKQLEKLKTDLEKLLPQYR